MAILFRTLLLVTVGLASAACSNGKQATAGDEASTPSLRLRVMTYNIHHGEGTDGRIDLERVARVIREQAPDLVALQEVDVKTERSRGVDQAAELGRLTGMRVTFGRAIDYEGGQYGQAILSRFPVREFKVHVLPGDPEREQRAAVAAWTRPWGEKGPRVRFVGTHLHHLSEDDRVQQADELNRLFAATSADGGDDPAILVGDLNAQAGSPPMERLLGHWRDAAADLGPGHTFPATAPNRRIDYILLRPAGAWRVAETRVVDEAVASDHRPVVADLEWIGPSRRATRSDN
jgi:endonuclease/exonuclease/phosphatase family metal-dependent hydrolase